MFSSDPAACRSDIRALIAFILILLLVTPYHLQAQTSAPQGLSIEVIEGEGAINNIRLRTAREAIVEVQDENHKPVSGALVLFSARGGNPFSRTVLRATTDSTGRVRANPLDLRSKAGRLEIHVRASYQGRTATQVIHQTNSQQGGSNAAANPSAVGVVAVAAGGGMSALGILAIVAVAAGGAVGGLFGAGVIGGGGKSAQISVGTPHF